jgi:putative MATE family efflux protein
MTNVIIVALNFFLIYPTRPVEVLGTTLTIPGAGLGVAGAAAATAAATAFSGTCMFLALFRSDSPVGISLRDNFRFKGDIVRQAVKLGVPAGLERATISVGQLVMTALISGCGTVALSANQLANTGESLCYMPVFGFSIAATTLVAQSLGAGQKDLAYEFSSWCFRLSVIVMLVTSTAMFIFAPQIMDLFIDDPAVIKLGAQMLRIEAFAEPLLAIGTVAGGVFRGAGDTRWPFYISIVGMWVVRVTMAVILIKVFHWGLAAVWVAMAFDWLARASISLVRFVRGKWMSAWA